MKIRNGFVSNSSSSSFIIKKDKLSKDQIDAIISNDYKDQRWCDEWNIFETDNTIGGNTFMDNYDITLFLSKIGVPSEFIEMDGENY